jgi:hypothetical protein
MLLPEDDYPLHQSARPLAHAMDGHPNAYDRFWFNGYNEEFYFALALGLYPNRGVIDAAFSVVLANHQYSVFASDALVGRPTAVGPVSIEIIEPLRVNRIRVDAPEQAIFADLVYRQRSATCEEPRQTMYDGPRIFMDVTRATQLGTWSGWIETPEGRFELPGDVVGTKDRSWGVRPVGEPLPGAPSTRAPQLCFLWAPLNFADRGLHFMTFNDSSGNALSRSASLLPLRDDGEAVATSGSLELRLQPGTRWLRSALLTMGADEIELTPILRFQMRGAGYSHPEFAHGRWHGGPVRAGEVLALDELDPLDYANIHVQHVVRATSSRGTGLGVLEQLIIGPYGPCGLEGLLDGA